MSKKHLMARANYCCVLFLLLWPISRAQGAPKGSLSDAVDPEFALRRATQEVFRDVSESARRYLVRVETVGGSQPRTILPVPGEKNSEDSARKRTQNIFQDTPGSDFVIADGATTGIVYSRDGYIITSSFNFIRDPVLISVLLWDGRRLAADLVARDQVRKIALLKVDANDLPVPEWKDMSEVRIGEWAVALGLGFGGDAPSVTVGIVSALNRMAGNAIQTDAKLNPANYGGPVCDISGRFTGMCVPMAQRPGELAGVEMYDAGVGFILPKRRIDEIVESLKRGTSFYRGWLGMQMDPRSVDAVVVNKLADPSPLRSAGVLPGDRIVAAQGKPLMHFGHLMQTLYMLPAGEEVALTIERQGAQFDVAVRLARNTELGPLPEEEEPFDPSAPSFPEGEPPAEEE